MARYEHGETVDAITVYTKGRVTRSPASSVTSLSLLLEPRVCNKELTALFVVTRVNEPAVSRGISEGEESNGLTFLCRNRGRPNLNCVNCAHFLILFILLKD